ncbi:Cytochrome c-552 [Ensifer psoraleae]|uniref:c-type cytochrome n=1 Tax=Sinorhizobium psoraleae TaxID=520838 RepID=UPI001FEA6D5A|nr:c-type cytochrome [Sinorhizobium psoraleae]NRP69556.1 Cytochrome c-552 [Sinorhizobium psoraleae]
MHVNWKHVAVVLAILPFAVVLGAWIGFFNVGASSGHWKITDWFLHFAMRSAVRTYALAVEVPPELPHHAVQTAAGHFARGCALCHGAPGEPRSPAVLRMLPQPPDLAERVNTWSDAELFRIVKHGVRFTGMPAWPSEQREDEAWAMVAFLRRLPALGVEGYRDLAYGPAGALIDRPTTFQQALAECTRCHGVDGRGRSTATPVIAGQNETYLLQSLGAYAEDRRASGVMNVVAKIVDRRHWQGLAAHFAALPPPPGRPGTATELVEAGRKLATEGNPSRRIPACLVCHASRDRNPVFPSLAGQPAPYVEQQLRLFREGRRGGTGYGHLMREVARTLSDNEIVALAAYFATAESRPARSIAIRSGRESR